MPRCGNLGWAALLAVSMLQAGELEDLRKEIQQVRSDYESRLRLLEEKLVQMEKQQAALRESNAETERLAAQATQQAAEAAALAESNRRTLRRITATPLFDIVREEPQKDFEFHGYARSGFGVNERGGQQVAFQAPGALAKSRLGNEAETYAEMVFVNNWLNPKRDENKAWFKTEVLVMAITRNLSSFDSSSEFKLREAFGQTGNLLPGRWSGVKFWAGSRYYQRQDVHINDFWYTDMSGYGGGVEDVPVGPGKASLAYIGSALPTSSVNVTGNMPKSTIDLRWLDIQTPLGTMGAWYDFAFSKGALLADGRRLQSADGHSVGFEHKRTEWLGGFHKASLQYGTGAASNLVATPLTPTLFWQNARTILYTQHALFQPNERFAFQPALILHWNKPGDPGAGFNRWVSIGGRPMLFFNRWFGLAFDVNADNVRNARTANAGWLRKFTISPQLATAPGFFARPVLRGFVTWANWTASLKGQVGGAAYSNRTNGLAAGLQVESWW